MPEARTNCRAYLRPTNNGERHVCLHDKETGATTFGCAHEVSTKVCAECQSYRPRGIQFPIVVDSVNFKSLDCALYKNKIGRPVAVRLAGEEGTHLGVFLGELPWLQTVRFDEKARELTVESVPNPAIFVPSLKRVVYGAECWWRVIDDSDGFKSISDADIDSQWYVQAAKALFDKEEKK